MWKDIGSVCERKRPRAPRAGAPRAGAPIETALFLLSISFVMLPFFIAVTVSAAHRQERHRTNHSDAHKHEVGI